MILGVLLTLAGLHELSHRTRMAGYDQEPADDDTAEFETIGGAEVTRPPRRRW
jgi:hypothetical protein